MWIIFTIVALPVILLFLYELKIYKLRKYINRFPGPKPVPILGNALQYGKNGHEIFDTSFRLWHDYGKGNFRMWIAFTPFVYICDPKDMEFILTSNELITKTDVYDMLYPWLGKGLLTATGNYWRKHRKMITPSFHFKILQFFHESMNKNSTKFIEKLREVSKGETIFDFQEMTHSFTLDLICDTAMGVNINAMDNSNSVLVEAFKEMCNNTNTRAFKPLERSNTLYKFSPDYPKYKRALTTLQDFTYDVIEKRIKARKELENSVSKLQADEFSREKMAFLDTLLTASIEGVPLSNQEIYEEVSTFIFEGHDTTSSAISFLVYILSRHPEIQQKVHAEQMQIMGGDLSRDASHQEISEMKYLDLVLKETLRMFPSVPLVARYCDQDYDINGQIYPKGTSLMLFIMALNYNEKTFKDPYLCKPERFEGDEINTFGYVPFSAGPRNCIGQKFAQLEIKTVISKIVRIFEILPPLDELISTNRKVQHFMGLSKEEQTRLNPNPSKYDPILSMVVTLKSDNGIQVRFRERHQ